MKKFLLLIFLSLIFNLSFAQWTQLGSNINGETAGDRSGYSVSISSSGLIVAIGSTKGNSNGKSSGHVRLFEFSGGDWVQMAGNIEGVAKNDHSGFSVSLSSDGYIVAIGAPYNDEYGDVSGQVRIYRYTGNHWIQMGSDLNGDNAYSHFGNSVSLCSDGYTVAIGAKNNGLSSTGQINIFEYNGIDWIQKGSIIPGEADYDRWGSSVSINSDGNIVAGSAENSDGTGTDSGNARVYEFVGGDWIQLGGNINGEAEWDNFGNSISISQDGNIIAIGALANDNNGNNAGQVKVYQYTGGNWIQIGSEILGEAAGDVAGSSVCLNSDGSILSIGSPGNNGSFNSAGSVRVFENDGGTWFQIGNSVEGEAKNDNLGTSVFSNTNGNIIAMGAPLNDENGRDAGQVQVYTNCDISNDTIDIKVTECESYVAPSGNSVWTKSGVYLDTIYTSEGCDYIVQIDLEIKDNTDTPTVIDTITCEDFISPSGYYVWNVSGTYIDIVPNSVGCDSTIIINLTSNTTSVIDTTVCDVYISPSGKYSWSTSGVYIDTIPNAIGCDSIITINLQSRDYASHIIVACDSTKYTSPSGKYIWTTDGIYQDTIPTIAGCDSILTIDLSFNVDTSIYDDFIFLMSNEEDAAYHWIDCDNPDEVLHGANDQYFKPYRNGNYAVIVTKGGCTDTSNCHFHLYIGIPENSENDELEIYPIPTSGIIKIEAKGITNVEIWDLQGRQVYLGKESEIDLSNSPDGLYLVTVTFGDKVLIRKIIKQ